MPVTKKGREILNSMVSEYGPEKGKAVFYASANKGTISGVHKTKDARIRLRDSLRQGKTFDEAMAGLMPDEPPPPVSTTDAKMFRKAFKDAIEAGKSPRQALEMGCISGVKNPNPTPNSQAAMSTSDSKKIFRDSFRKAMKGGKATRDALAAAFKDSNVASSMPSLAVKTGVTQ